jgi:hypothetical protein
MDATYSNTGAPENKLIVVLEQAYVTPRLGAVES